MDLELSGRRALVTGATRGIGRAIAERASWISGTNVVVDGAQNQPGMEGW